MRLKGVDLKKRRKRVRWTRKGVLFAANEEILNLWTGMMVTPLHRGIITWTRVISQIKVFSARRNDRGPRLTPRGSLEGGRAIIHGP